MPTKPKPPNNNQNPAKFPEEVTNPKVNSSIHTEAHFKNKPPGAKQSEFKHVKKSGKSSKNDAEKGRKGQMMKEIRKKVTGAGGGKKTKHHDEDHHRVYKHKKGGSAHGGKFRDGAKRKKLNYKKVYNHPVDEILSN